eukprot:48447-Chlamydomonas_euryale.AAC.1
MRRGAVCMRSASPCSGCEARWRHATAKSARRPVGRSRCIAELWPGGIDAVHRCGRGIDAVAWGLGFSTLAWPPRGPGLPVPHWRGPHVGPGCMCHIGVAPT